jgi:hypothetical protein
MPFACPNLLGLTRLWYSEEQVRDGPVRAGGAFEFTQIGQMFLLVGPLARPRDLLGCPQRQDQRSSKR